MTTLEYLDLKKMLIEAGHGEEIDWAEGVRAPKTPDDFFCEYAWVVINSGMKNQVAQKIWDRVRDALNDGEEVFTVFRHPGKASAIQDVWESSGVFFDKYKAAPDKLAFLKGLPWIGEITKYHLAKNLGMDVCKPDRHLVRIAEGAKTTPTELCGRLSAATGDRIGTVDTVIWRAANLGWV